MNLPIRRQDLTRQTRFSFTCSRCLSCCRNKKIQVNPYELARLAQNRGLSTARFTERYTTAGGTLLQWSTDGTCIFLDEHGCSVHPDRPLVCRLYPLGRHLRNVGEESFSEIVPDPLCKGVYGQDETIEEYLQSQAAQPFLDAADRYLILFLKLFLQLKEHPGEDVDREAITDVFRKSAAGERDMLPADVDTTVMAWCQGTGIPFPVDVEKKMAVHIMALESWVHTIGRS